MINGNRQSFPVRGWTERRAVVLGAAALATVAIFAARQAGADAASGLAFLYVVPVAFVGVELGLRPGLGTALGCAALTELWMQTKHVHNGAMELIAGAGAMLAVALITGRFADRMRAGRSRQLQLLESGLALAALSDPAALPGLVAKRARELVPAHGVRVTIDGARPAELGRLDGPLLGFKLTTGASELGMLEVGPARKRPVTPEQRLSLELLAMQAAVAAENQRLLVLQRGQAALHAELSDAQGRLAEQGERVELLLAQQERERSDLARELHNQSAQALVAIQLGLRAVERDLGSRPSRAHVETLRATLAETSGALRDLAVGLRPPSLDELGLEPALRGLANRASTRSGRKIRLLTDGITDRLETELETTVYRLTDDIIAVLTADADVRVALDPAGAALTIVATQTQAGKELSLPAGALAPIRARLELTTGSLSVDRDTIVARVPLPAPKCLPAGAHSAAPCP
ncbi:MAG: histidine kinase [Solirubrobacteraceae bacterium]|jgi:signal transduction histidine kinase